MRLGLGGLFSGQIAVASELFICFFELPRKLPPVGKSNLGSAVAAAGRRTHGIVLLSRPAIVPNEAGFQPRQRCPTTGADSDRLSADGVWASTFFALKRLIPAASSKIARRSRGDAWSIRSTFPCSIKL